VSVRCLGPFLSSLPVFGGHGREEAGGGRCRGSWIKAPLSHISSEGGAEERKNTPPTRVSSEGGVVVALEWVGDVLYKKKL
jgi:hypothetical protein